MASGAGSRGILATGRGDDLHLEVTTAGEQAILFSNKSNSWFGVTDVLVTDKDQSGAEGAFFRICSADFC